jgi:hypothetical protein
LNIKPSSTSENFIGLMIAPHYNMRPKESVFAYLLLPPSGAMVNSQEIDSDNAPD